MMGAVMVVLCAVGWVVIFGGGGGK